jgi:hypothetical protein
MCERVLARRDHVHVDVEQPLVSELEVVDAHFFEHLAARGVEHCLIARLDVAARLQPQTELGVVDEQELRAVRREHE